MTANKQLSQPARRRAVRGRARAAARSFATRPPWPASCPVIRVMRESFAGAHIEKVHGIVNGTTNYILTEMARTGATYARRAGARAGARLRGGRPDRGRERQGCGRQDGDPRAARVPRRRCSLDDVPFEGIEEITPDDIDYAKEFGLVLKLLGVAERRDGGVSVRVFPVLPLRRPSAGVGGRALQRGHARVAGDHRGDALRPGRGRARRRPPPCSATSCR